MTLTAQETVRAQKFLRGPRPPAQLSAEARLATPMLPGLAPELNEVFTWTMQPGPLPIPLLRIKVNILADQRETYIVVDVAGMHQCMHAIASLHCIREYCSYQGHAWRLQSPCAITDGALV
jgi:hypothetical protein